MCVRVYGHDDLFRNKYTCIHATHSVALGTKAPSFVRSVDSLFFNLRSFHIFSFRIWIASLFLGFFSYVTVIINLKIVRFSVVSFITFDRREYFNMPAGIIQLRN